MATASNNAKFDTSRVDDVNITTDATAASAAGRIYTTNINGDPVFTVTGGGYTSDYTVIKGTGSLIIDKRLLTLTTETYISGSPVFSSRIS